LPVLFRARPGPRTTVSKASVEMAPAGLKLPTLLTQPEQPYRLRTLALDKNALLQALRDSGYLQAQLEAQVEWSEDKSTAQVSFRVTPGPETRFGDVVVAGLQRTREEVVRRELMVAPGDPFSPTKLVEAQRRLQGLGIFERVEAHEIASEPGEQQPVVVALDEAPRAAIAYGVGYAEHDLLRGSVEVTLKNLAGMDRTLSTYARISFLGSRLLATYKEPRLFGHRRDLYLTAFREEQERDSFSYLRYGALVQTARALSRRLTFISRFTYQRTETFNIKVPISEIDREFLPSTFSGPSASLVLDTRNDPLIPKRGVFVGADASLSHRVLGGDSFAKSLIQAASFTSLTPRLVLALAGRIGLSRTYHDEPPRLPLPERFFAGGDYSLRGYDLDSVDPEGGNALLLGSVELRFAVTPRWELAAFSDLGNTYPLVSDMRLNDLLYTVGAGIRYRTPIGPLRIDYGHKLNPRPGESTYHVHVTVGYAF
jgi:outer membrane protein insertion porin family